MSGAANQVVGIAKRGLRDTFGLWPLFEARNRALLGHRLPALRRFEDREVSRLSKQVGPLDETLVSTVMPTYKRPELLVKAIESALAQTVTDQRVIVVDDGAGLPEKLPDDPRVVAVSLARNTAVLGLVRNVGIRLTRSRYLAFLDDDNEWRSDHLEVALAALDNGASIVYTAVERRLADGSLLDRLSVPFDRKTFADSSSYVDANSIVIRRDPSVLFSRIPRVKKTLPKEDWEFVHRMAKTRLIQHVPVPTVHYMVNQDSYYTDWK